MKKTWLVLIAFILILAASQPAAAVVAPGAPLTNADSTSVVKGQYIVVLKPGNSINSVAQAAQRASDLGATILYQYTSALQGYAAVIPDQALNAVLRDSSIAYIEADQVVTLDATQSPATWGIDRIDQRALPLSNSYTYNYEGTGVTAYVIDTGIRYGHTQFGGRASFGYDTFGGDGSDCNGHGTHVSGTIGGSTYGVAKKVSLVSVRVLNCSGSGTWSGVIAGIDWVTAHHTALAVANMSLGGGPSSSVDTAVANSIASGVTYAIAAGNNGKDACRYSPARVPAAITVGATSSTDSRTSWSNYGRCLDLFAPGNSITSAWNTSDTATNTISGTSMATPHVAGVAALYLDAHGFTSPADVAAALTSGGTAGVVKSAGRGSPNILLYSLLP